MKTITNNTIGSLIALAMIALMPATTMAADLFYGDDSLGGGTYWADSTPTYDAYDTGSYWADSYPTYDAYDYSSYWADAMPTYDTSYDSYWADSVPTYDLLSDVNTILTTDNSWSDVSNVSAPFYNNVNNSSRSFAPTTISTPRYTTGGTNIASAFGANIIYTPTYSQPVASQPIVINNQPAQAQPITITNNNVNTNVNTNTNPAPVYTAPTYVAPAPALQCSTYATASAYKGAKVTLSWATSGGTNTQVVCDGNVLNNQTVSAVSSISIYPSKSTTCYVTVRSNVDTKSCSAYVPVQEAPVVTYVAPQPTYIPPVAPAPVVMYHPEYIPTTPVVTVESMHKPVYKSIKLTETPYTGFEDYLYPMFLGALALTAGYATINRRRILKLA